MLTKIILPILAVIVSTGSYFAQVFTYQNTMTPAQLVSDILLGQGVTATNITFNNSAANATAVQNSARSFSATGFPFANGVYLRTQGATSIAGDPQLSPIASGPVTNGSILEFDFVATGNDLSFRYVFASSEYSGYTCSSFNDAFGFFISGPGITGYPNIAKVPNSNIPVSINTVNSGVASGGNPSACAAADPNWQANSIYFTTTYGTFSNESYNGSTVAMTAISNLICGETYHIKLAVCNVTDQILNSGVYLEGGSFTTFPVEFGFNTFTFDNTIYEGCNQFGTLMFTRAGCDDVNTPLTAYLTYAGAAENGVDYTLLGDSVYFAPGEDTIYWQIVPFEDGITEGIENMEITIMSILSSGDTVYSTGEFFIQDVPELIPNGQDVSFQCQQDTASVYAVISGGFAPYTYSWPDNSTNSSYVVDIPGNGTQEVVVTITDACGYQINDTMLVIMNQTLAIDSMLQYPATACTPTGTVVGFASGITGTPIYNWIGPGPTGTNSIEASVFQNLSPGWYYFTVTDNVCSVNDSILLTQDQAPLADFSANVISGCSPLTVNFTNNSQNATTYAWNFGNGQTANVNDLSGQSAVYTSNATVQLIASQGACGDTMTIFIGISNCGCTDPAALNFDPAAQVNDGSCYYPIPTVEVPNVFTPDGSGANDVYFLTTTNASSVEMTIFNRWGNIVFSGSGANPTWDGKVNGTMAKEGVYFVQYKVNAIKGEGIEGHGFLHLIIK